MFDRKLILEKLTVKKYGAIYLHYNTAYTRICSTKTLVEALQEDVRLDVTQGATHFKITLSDAYKK